jgi:hypothetical protein
VAAVLSCQPFDSPEPSRTHVTTDVYTPSLAERTVERGIPLQSTASIYDEVLSLTDYRTGILYTLNVTQGVVYTSTQEIWLDADLNATLAEEMKGNESADPASEDALGLGCDGNSCNQELRQSDPEGAMLVDRGTRAPAVSQGRVRWRRTGMRDKPVRRKGAQSLQLVGAPKPEGVRSWEAALLQWSCPQIAGDLMRVAYDYRSSRTSFLAALFGAAGIDAYNVVTSRLPRGSGSASAALATLGGLQMSRTQLAVMGSFYNIYNCGSRTVHVGVIMMPTASGSLSPGGAYRLACHEVGYEISFDGGDNWHPITVTECQWQMT